MRREPSSSELAPYYDVIAQFLNRVAADIRKEKVRSKMRRAGRGWKLS